MVVVRAQEKNAMKKVPKSEMSFHDRQNMQHGQKIREQIAAELKEERLARQDKSKDAELVEQFRGLLKYKYGDLVAAWALGLDRFAAGRLGFNTFCKACRSIGYEGNVSRLYKAMDLDKSGTICLRELDPDCYDVFDKFRDHLEIHYGSVEQAWYEISAGQTMLPYEEFKARVELVGFRAKPSAMKFDIWAVTADWKRMRALCGSIDSKLHLWNLDTGECERTFTGHSDLVTSLAADWDAHQ